MLAAETRLTWTPALCHRSWQNFNNLAKLQSHKVIITPSVLSLPVRQKYLTVGALLQAFSFFCWCSQMFRIRRVEKLTPAADWNVTLCWGMFAGFGWSCYLSRQETKAGQFCVVTPGVVRGWWRYVRSAELKSCKLKQRGKVNGLKRALLWCHVLVLIIKYEPCEVHKVSRSCSHQPRNNPISLCCISSS